MEDAITNVVADETQTQVVNEENNVANQETQAQAPENTEAEVVENSNQEGAQEETNESQEEQKELTHEELKARLREYEVREEEDRALKERLGLQDIDAQTFNYMNIDQQIVNEGKQVYLRLCTEYGIDANPNRIDESIAKLKETDPAKAYEFQRKFEMLGGEVSAKRQAIQQQTAYYEVSKFANDHNQILNASPALNNLMTQYVQNYGATPHMYQQLQNVMDIVLPLYSEAFEAGKRYSLEDKAKKDTSAVQGGIATANTNTYSAGTTFTREQIAKMSPADFAKYEKVIEQQMREGKIQ